MEVLPNNSRATLYPHWNQQPLRLTSEEMERSMLILAEFFSSYHQPDARACLKQWLDDAVHARDVHTANHLTLYDDIERLVEAAWVLHSRKEQALTVQDNTTLPAIVQLLVTAMQPERIFLLQHTPGKLIDLLIIIPDTARTRFGDYDALIAAVCAGYEEVSFSLHQSSHIRQHITQGNLFYATACSAGNIMYDNGKTLLAITLPQLVEVMIAQARERFANGKATANCFLEGAKLYYKKEENTMAAFMLH